MSDPGLRIAVVDDDAAVRKALARLLRASAFCVETFASSREFLASLGGPFPHCLIVDLEMPETSGLELYQRLAGAGLRIPAILITTHGDAALCRRAREAGISACLDKPLLEASLLATIEQVAGQSTRKARQDESA